jgi:hypothetical protein
MTLTLYQSYIGEHQHSFISPIAVAYDAGANIGEDQREYELFKAISAQRKGNREPWGLISWKFCLKSLISVEEFYQFAASLFRSGHDCVFINPMIGYEAIFLNVWEQWAAGDARLAKVNLFLNEIVGTKIFAPMTRNCFCACNYFAATPDFWKSYFSFVDEVLKELDRQASQRTEVGLIYLAKGKQTRDRELTKQPFIIERLFSTFLLMSPSIRYSGYVHSVDLYKRKFGERLGHILYKLSEMKNTALNENNNEMLSQWHRLRLSILTSPTVAVVTNLDDPPVKFLSSDFASLLGSPER